MRLRLRELEGAAPWTPDEADALVATRRREADLYHASARTAPLSADERHIVRAADAGLVWSRQFYHLIVPHWLDGDPGQPPVAPGHGERRDAEWRHLYARDVITMPDKWEYPWFAAWDLAFHCVAMARTDPELAKAQLLLLMREWYAHPNGALPAYEFAFGDANPPVHAWAAWRVYRLAAESGHGKDRVFLARAFHKALVNFGWWVNRKHQGGRNLFEGGFLGLDNIGVFDRSRPLPGGVALEQADATAWMAFYCTTMLAIALELASDDRAYSDIATKFLEHFLAIAAAMNRLGAGLWDDEDGFYYDVAQVDGRPVPLRLRSLVGLVPLLAAESLDEAELEAHPRFMRRLAWSVSNEPDLMKDISCLSTGGRVRRRLLAIPSRERLVRVLRRMLDERELLSPFGIRSLSKAYADTPYVAELGGTRHEVRYTPGESDSGLFGGNSNWRGPVWLPLNYLLIESLKRHHHFYGDTLEVECPTGSGVFLTLRAVAEELERRLARLFLPDASGRRPYQGEVHPALDAYRDHVLFYEYFHGDTGRGVGASHQTGWTALIGNVLESIALAREGFPVPRAETHRRG